MLESVFIVRHIVVVVVGIGKETVSRSKDIACADIGCRQESLVRLLDSEDLLLVESKVLAQLVPQIGVGISVSDNLHRLLASDRAVVGGQHDGVVAVA